MTPKVSIIIRTKNEERWITACLKEVYTQDYTNFEVIVVDNQSTDKTLQRLQQFPIEKTLTCENYLPGKALNIGIQEARGELIVCLSGHCIPVNKYWLRNLVRNFNDPEVAGVYGRQEPMSFSADADKRDLTLIFGLDRRIQHKDSFFHNANSMIRRQLWKHNPFDDQATNIEDRLWARKMLQQKYKIVYDPEASVYHYHGIHQNGNLERCTNVVRILEKNKDIESKEIDLDKLNIVAIIPVRGPLHYLGKKPLIYYTIKKALQSRFIKQVIVSTDNEDLASVVKKMGAEVPFLRDPKFSQEHIDLVTVLQYTLQKLEESNILPDIVVPLEITFPFRRDDLLDAMLNKCVSGGYDSLVAVKRENKAIWKKKNKALRLLEEGITPRKFKDTTFVELRGTGAAIYPNLVREGIIIGQKHGVFEINDPFASIEVRSPDDFKLASMLMSQWDAQGNA